MGRVLLILTAIMVALLIGCKNDRSICEEDMSLPTIEQVRIALLEFVKDNPDAVIRMSYSFLQTEKPTTNKNSVVMLGNWAINIREKTFLATVDTGSHFAQYRGKFVYDNGGWKAVLVDVVRD